MCPARRQARGVPRPPLAFFLGLTTAFSCGYHFDGQFFGIQSKKNRLLALTPRVGSLIKRPPPPGHLTWGGLHRALEGPPPEVKLARPTPEARAVNVA